MKKVLMYLGITATAVFFGTAAFASVNDDQVAQVLRTAATPQAACDVLIKAANAAGGRDNITVVVVEPQSHSG